MNELLLERNPIAARFESLRLLVDELRREIDELREENSLLRRQVCELRCDAG